MYLVKFMSDILDCASSSRCCLVAGVSSVMSFSCLSWILFFRFSM